MDLSKLAIEFGKINNRFKTYNIRYLSKAFITPIAPGYYIISGSVLVTPTGPVLDKDGDIQIIAGRFKRRPLTDDERKRRIDQNLYLYYRGPDYKAF